MRVQIQCEGFDEGKQIPRQVERLLYLALGRYLSEVRSVRVRLQATPKLSRHQCTLVLKMVWGETLRLEQADPDLLEAASRVAVQAGRHVGLQVELRRTGNNLAPAQVQRLKPILR